MRVEWEERTNGDGTEEKREREGRHNRKAIRVLRRCETLAVLSESESLFVEV